MELSFLAYAAGALAVLALLIILIVFFKRKKSAAVGVEPSVMNAEHESKADSVEHTAAAVVPKPDNTANESRVSTEGGEVGNSSSLALKEHTAPAESRFDAGWADDFSSDFFAFLTDDELAEVERLEDSAYNDEIESDGDEQRV